VGVHMVLGSRNERESVRMTAMVASGLSLFYLYFQCIFDLQILLKKQGANNPNNDKNN
jgi:hypothetical protein